MTTPQDPNVQPGAALAPNPDVVNEFHRYSDVDNSPDSHHHTIGIDPNQASPGDHNHDGRNSKTLNIDLSKYISKVDTAIQSIVSRFIINRDSGTATGWQDAGLEIRDVDRPRITFHQPGKVASQIGQEPSSEILRTYNNPGTDYAHFRAFHMFEKGTRNLIERVKGNWGQHVLHGTHTDFNSTTMEWGADFVQGATNGPAIAGAGQYYNMNLSLGSNYPLHGASSYACQLAIARNVPGKLATRFKENNAWGPWKEVGHRRIAAVQGPGAATTYGGNVTLLSLAANVIAGRKYRVSFTMSFFDAYTSTREAGYGYVTAGSGSFEGGPGLYATISDWYVFNTRDTHGFSGAATYTASATGSVTFTGAIQTTGVNTYIVPANSCFLAIEEI